MAGISVAVFDVTSVCSCSGAEHGSNYRHFKRVALIEIQCQISLAEALPPVSVCLSVHVLACLEECSEWPEACFAGAGIEAQGVLNKKVCVETWWQEVRCLRLASLKIVPTEPDRVRP